VRPPAADLARHARPGDGVEVVVLEPRLHVDAAHAGRAQLAQRVLGLEDRVVGRQLGLAVVVPDARAGQFLHQLLEDLHGHDRGPVVALLQAPEVVLAEIRVPQHPDPDRGRGEEHGGLVVGDVLEDLADVGGDEDVRAAHPEDGVQEHVALGAVIDGQGVDLHVVLVVLPVHDAAHVLGHEGLVRDDDALGQRLGPARVGHLDGILDAQDGVRLRRGIGPVPGLEVLERVAHGRLARALAGPDPRLDRRHLAEDVLDEVVERVLHDEDLALRVVDAVGDVLAAQQVVDGEVHGARLAAPEPRQDVVDRVVRQDGHAVVLLHAEVDERVGHPVALALHLGVGHLAVPEDHRRLVGVVIGAAPDHVGNDPAVDLVVAGHQVLDGVLVEGVELRLFRVRQGNAQRHKRNPPSLSGLCWSVVIYGQTGPAVLSSEF